MCFWRLWLQNNESGISPMRSTFSVVLFPLDEKRAVWLRPVSKRLSHKGRHEAANTFDWRRFLLFTSSVWFGFWKFCIKIAKRQQTVFSLDQFFTFTLFHLSFFMHILRVYHTASIMSAKQQIWHHIFLFKKSHLTLKSIEYFFLPLLVCRWRESESTMGLCRMEVVEENLEEEESTGMICLKQR